MPGLLFSPSQPVATKHLQHCRYGHSQSFRVSFVQTIPQVNYGTEKQYQGWDIRHCQPDSVLGHQPYPPNTIPSLRTAVSQQCGPGRLEPQYMPSVHETYRRMSFCTTTNALPSYAVLLCPLLVYTTEQSEQ